jgi:hypothetical protein
MFKRLRITSIFFVLGVFLSFSTAAFASQAISSTSNFGTIYGYSYSGYSVINAYSGNAYAVAVLDCTQTAPSGYMGASAYLYQQSTGQCVSYTPWTYNSSPTNVLNPSTDFATTPDAYCAKGAFQMYNGNGYTGGYSAYSPYLNNY